MDAPLVYLCARTSEFEATIPSIAMETTSDLGLPSVRVSETNLLPYFHETALGSRCVIAWSPQRQRVPMVPKRVAFLLAWPCELSATTKCSHSSTACPM
jgi:hypothetical protein